MNAPTTTVGLLKSAVTRRKGRGFSSAEDPTALPGIHHFDILHEESSGRIQRSVEGWILFVTGLHEEITEDDLYDRFADYGAVKAVKVNLDHRTGYVKGYGLVEFAEWEAARRAREELDGSSFMDSTLRVDFAFVKPPTNK